MDFEELKILASVLTEPLSKADAMVCLEGDGQERAKEALRLFNQGWAPLIIVSGGNNKIKFSVPADKMADYLIKNGIPENKIIIESGSQNTKEQAEQTMGIVKTKGFKKIILIASNFHQPRAFLTFLKGMENARMNIVIINAPVRDLSWFDNNVFEKPRIDLLQDEFLKIKEYSEKGHVFSIDKAIEYQKWKEKQI